MKGIKIYYNFITKHQAINCCPYELAIPNLELGKNKWLDLIRLSKIELERFIRNQEINSLWKKRIK